MLQPPLQQRFDRLLSYIKNPSLRLLVGENVAAAKELLDTLLMCGLLLPEEWKAYQTQIESAKLVAGAVELKRVTDAIRSTP